MFNIHESVFKVMCQGRFQSLTALSTYLLVLVGNVQVREEGHTTLLLANKYSVNKINLVTNESALVVDHQRSVYGVDYIYDENLVFWTDAGQRLIQSVNETTGHPINKVLTTDIIHPDGIAVDWIYKHIYWTDLRIGIIGVCDLQGITRKTLFDTGLTAPRPIAVDPIVGWMFWADVWGDSAKIERAGMDGCCRESIITTDIEWPNGLSLDYIDKRIFWVDARLGILSAANYDGSQRKTVIADRKVMEHSFGIDVFEDSVYWSVWTSDDIHSANKLTGQNITTLYKGNIVPMGLKVYHPLRQRKSQNYCDSLFEHCSDFCFPTPRISPTSPYITCACPNGKTLAEDGLNCTVQVTRTSTASQALAAPPEESHTLIFLASQDSIKKINMVTNESTTVVTDQRMVTSVDYIHDADFVFWTDEAQSLIQSVNVTTGHPIKKVISTGIIAPEGIAVDWIYEHIYWTDVGARFLGVCDFQGITRKTLFFTGLDAPGPVAVDPIDGWMFWADWGDVPKIERAGMDGCCRENVITMNIRSPNGLALDYVLKRIFWLDDKLGTLTTANYDGSERRTLITDRKVLEHSFGIDVFEDSVYWSDWKSNVIHSANKLTGQVTSTVYTGNSRSLGIRVYHPLKQPKGENYCKNLPENCSHFCFPTPPIAPTSPNITCACPNGKTLAKDGLNCR